MSDEMTNRNYLNMLTTQSVTLDSLKAMKENLNKQFVEEDTKIYQFNGTWDQLVFELTRAGFSVSRVEDVASIIEPGRDVFMLSQGGLVVSGWDLVMKPWMAGRLRLSA